MVVEELCKNYSKLQLEVQALKRELQSARENEGKVEIKIKQGCYSSTHMCVQWNPSLRPPLT